MSDHADPPLTPRAALRWALVHRITAELRPGSILEIGCGMGGAGVRLARLATSYVAVEPDDRSWSLAHERIAPLGGTVIHGDHTKVPQDTRYDLVCAFEVLEHIADDKGALAEWFPLVRPGGHIMLSVPGYPDRFGPSDVLAGHYRRYTPTELDQRLSEAGAVDVDVRHYGWPLSYALEAVRNRLVKPRLADATGTAPEEFSATSGRQFQPTKPLVGAVIRAGVLPFTWLQALRPTAGPNLLVLARRPA